MTSTFTLEVELENRSNPIEIEVECSACVENDGIGPYEFWGQKCNDRGRDYLVIEETEWNKEGFTDEENAAIEKEIEKNVPLWEENMMESWGDSCIDCDDSREDEDWKYD